jgi:hypothetical protein
VEKKRKEGAYQTTGDTGPVQQGIKSDSNKESPPTTLKNGSSKSNML